MSRVLLWFVLAGVLQGGQVGDTLTLPVYRFGITLTQRPVSFVCVSATPTFQIFYPFERMKVNDLVNTIGNHLFVLVQNHGILMTPNGVDWSQVSSDIQEPGFRLYFLRDTPYSWSRFYFLSVGRFYRTGLSLMEVESFEIPGLSPEDSLVAMGFSPTYSDSVLLIASTHQVFRGIGIPGSQPHWYQSWTFTPIGSPLPRIRDIAFVDDSVFLVSTSQGLYRWNGTSYEAVLPSLSSYRLHQLTSGWIVGTENGLYTSNSDGFNWQFYGLAGTPIRAFDVHGDTVYAGVDNVGVLRLHNASVLDTLVNGLDSPAMVQVGSLQFQVLAVQNDHVYVATELGIFSLQSNTWVQLSGNTPEQGFRENYRWAFLDSVRVRLGTILDSVRTEIEAVLWDSLGISPGGSEPVSVFLYPLFEYWNNSAGVATEEIPVQGYPEPSLFGIVLNVGNLPYPTLRWPEQSASMQRTILGHLMALLALRAIDPDGQALAFDEGFAGLVTHWAYPTTYQGFQEGWQVDVQSPILAGNQSHTGSPILREDARERIASLDGYLYERLGLSAVQSLWNASDHGLGAYLSILEAYGEDPETFFAQWAVTIRYDSLGLPSPWSYETWDLPLFGPSRMITTENSPPLEMGLGGWASQSVRFSLSQNAILYVQLDPPVTARGFALYWPVSPSSTPWVEPLVFDSTGLALDTVSDFGSSVAQVDFVVFNGDFGPTQAYVGVLNTARPSAPQDLRAESGHRSRVPLTWQKPTDNPGLSAFYTYTLYRSTHPTYGFTPIASGLEEETYVDTSVENGTLYYYFVTAVAMGSEGAPSETVSARPATFPSPRLLQAYDIGNGVYLHWEPPFDTLQDVYVIWRADSATMTFSVIDTTELQAYLDLLSSSDHLYFVTALYSNPEGMSAPTDTVVATEGTIISPGEDLQFPLTIGQVWTYTSNNGSPVGGEFSNGWLGMNWPGDRPNFYVWGSYLAVGADVNGIKYVTSSNYPPSAGEWYPEGMIIPETMESDLDVIMTHNDYANENDRNADGRHLGVGILQRTLNWDNTHPFLKNAKAYVFGITYHKDLSDIPGVGDTLHGVYIGLWVDADVSGAARPFHPTFLRDDWVDFDGWDGNSTDTDEQDEITLLPNGAYLPQPDGIPDEYLVFGDEPDEVTLHGDTLIVSRNTSYMYDGDDPSTPLFDVGEEGYSTGYIGATLIYAPPSPSDSVWVENGDTLRMVLPAGHAWWDWEHDPVTDADLYAALQGWGQRIMAPPNAVFEYRFLLSAGPFDIPDGDTIYVVYGVGVGEGLNGGDENAYAPGQWLPGLRHVIDALWRAYYQGAQHSDPFHPSGPTEDEHWGHVTQVEETSRPHFKRVRFLPFAPNPVRDFVNVRFFLPEPLPVTLKIYDVAGRLVDTPLRNVQMPAGLHTFRVRSRRTGGPLNSGVYFFRLRMGPTEKTRKVVILP